MNFHQTTLFGHERFDMQAGCTIDLDPPRACLPMKSSMEKNMEEKFAGLASQSMVSQKLKERGQLGGVE